MADKKYNNDGPSAADKALERFTELMIEKIQTQHQGKKGAFRHFDAYSAEKVGEDQFSYIWVHFVDFGDDQRVWLMPKTRIKAEGELELQVFKDRVSINCRVEDLSKWVKDESKQ